MSTTVTLTDGDFKAIIAMVGPPTYLQHSQRVEWFEPKQEALELRGGARHLSKLASNFAISSHRFPSGHVLACMGWQ